LSPIQLIGRDKHINDCLRGRGHNVIGA
jgi:hypothetical protein